MTYTNKGFTLLEIIIYIALLALIVSLVSSVVIYFSNANEQTKGDREVLENARRALQAMSYEITAAKSIYTPTTNANQLSLETSKYLPTDEPTTYIDFFICDLRICMKKETQNPTYLTNENVQVSSLTFTHILTNGSPSMRINLTLNYKNIIHGFQPSANVTSTITLRNNN